MSIKKDNIISRMLRLGLVILFQGLYLPLNQNLSGGYLSRVRLDDFIPILPAWTIPYVLWLPVCLFFALWAAWKMPENLFRAYFMAALFTISVSMLIFITIPTYVQRPEVSGSDIFSSMLRTVYQNDRLYNALPSGHVYLAVTTAFYYLCWRHSREYSLRTIRWNSPGAWFWIALVMIVSLSTIFTGQHSIIDIPGGFAASISGFLFSTWWMKRCKPAGAYET